MYPQQIQTKIAIKCETGKHVIVAKFLFFL